MGACESEKNQKSKAYFQVAKTIKEDENVKQSPNNQIKLDFRIENCTPDDNYKVMAEFLNPSLEAFHTEEVLAKHNMIIFHKVFLCEFFFQIPQLMRITLFKNGQNLGSFTPYLGMIVGSPNSCFRSNIAPDKPEIIIITAKGIGNFNDVVVVNFIIRTNKNVDFKNSNNKIYFMITNNERKRYTSESLPNTGQFKTKTIPLDLLQPNFEVSFFNSHNEKIVSKNETINSFTSQAGQLFLTLNINLNEYMIFNNSQLVQQYNFIDYIKNGVQIALSIGIDFTASNGPINNPNSLHRIIPGGFNDYEQAIKTCGLILAFYDYDQLFPVYGFGAVINNIPKANMCFNINFQEDPNIYTIDNVIQEYRKCLGKIIFAGPTEFCPMIRKEIDLILKENNPLIYHVLMILTDGVIVDQQQTIDAIIDASFLPFSLVIIGVGNDHFSEMVELDADVAPLISSNGTKMLRDVVQFVPFNIYRNNPNALSQEVLAEIPKQIVEFYSMLKIYPKNLNKAILRTKTIKKNNNIN